MANLIRWLRGAVGIGLTWSVLWMLIGLVLWAVLTIVDPGDIGPGEGLGTALPILGRVGFFTGLGFAALFSCAEWRHPLGELSLGRAALWGALGSAGIPLLMGTDGSMGIMTGTLGAVFAAASVAIARRETGSTGIAHPSGAAIASQ